MELKSASAASSPRKAILILGMHRSGTSALGGVVDALGVAGPKTLMGPGSDNPRGYFESVVLCKAHEELLAMAGTRWHDWRHLDPQWLHSESWEWYRQKLRKLLIDEFGDAPFIFIKDPRMCKFVPLISSILASMNIRSVAFLVLRNPLEVAYSLKRRDNFPLSKSILLWLRHELEAEFHSRHMPRAFLSYEDLLTDWRYHMDRAADETHVTWPDRSSQAAAKIDEFLSPDLRHERSSLRELEQHPEIPALVRKTYYALTSLQAGCDAEQTIHQLDRMRRKFEEGCEIFGSAMVAEEAVIEDLRSEVARSQHENSSLKAEVEQTSAKADRLAGERDALAADYKNLMMERDSVAAAHHDFAATNMKLVAERDGLAAANAGLVAERDRLAAANADLAAERDHLAAASAALITERDRLAAANAALIAELQSLGEAKDRLVSERDALVLAHNELISAHDALAREHTRLAAAQDDLRGVCNNLLRERDVMLGSRSWRWTRVLRWLRKSLSRPLRNITRLTAFRAGRNSRA